MRPLLLKRLYQYIPQIAQADVRTLKMFFRYRLGDVDHPLYSHLLRWNNSNHIKKHLSGAFHDELKEWSPTRDLCKKLPGDFNSWDPLSKAQWLETTIFMSGYLLSSQGDRMSMANSVEGRYPFLDYRVIELCNSLPSNMKLNGLTEKYLLKKLLIDKIPESIVTRVKQPYRAPVSNVFLSPDAPDWVEYMLSDEQTEKAGIFSSNSINTVLSRIKKTGLTSEMDDMLVTAVISAHLLYDQFIDDRNSVYQTGTLSNLTVTEDSAQVLTE